MIWIWTKKNVCREIISGNYTTLLYLNIIMQYKPFNRFNFIIENRMQNLMFKFNFASSVIPASELASKIVEVATSLSN